MDACVLCGGHEFYLEAGYYFCTECQTKHEVNLQIKIKYLSISIYLIVTIVNNNYLYYSYYREKEKK